MKWQQLPTTHIMFGSLPEAMQWKKTAAFAVAGKTNSAFTQWLRDLPEGLDTVTVNVETLQTGDPAAVYLLFGWSNSGTDELRRATLDSVLMAGHQICLYASRPQVEFEGSIMGTADMRFVGWEIPLDQLKQGIYQAQLFLRRDRIAVSASTLNEVRASGKGYESMGALEFRVP